MSDRTTPIDPLAGRSSAFGWISQPEQQQFTNVPPAAPPAATPPAAPPATPPADPAHNPAPPAPPAPATPPPAAPPATPPATPPAATDPITAPVGNVPFDQLPPETQAEVRRLRQADQQARQQRTEWEQAGITPERRKELGKLLGYEQDETPDPAALAASIAQTTTRAETAEARASELERANMVLLTAPDAGARAASLLDSKGFTESIKALDATDQTGIRTAIDTWLQTHPEHRASPAIPPSSATPRPQGATQGQPKPGLEGAISKAYQQGGITPS